jgi:hypothetical protein
MVQARLDVSPVFARTVKTVVLLLVSSSAVQGLRAQQEPECLCSQMAASRVQCFQSAWRRGEWREPTSVAKLDALLSALSEGDSESSSDPACGVETSETCEDRCLPVIWGAFVDLARSSEMPNDRWGSIALAFGTYTDVGAPKEAFAALERLAEHVLTNAPDVTSRSAALRMMKFYAFRSERLLLRILGLMESESTLERELAFQRLAQYAHCTLAFDASASAETRTTQIASIRRWWNARDGTDSPR